VDTTDLDVPETLVHYTTCRN